MTPHLNQYSQKGCIGCKPCEGEAATSGEHRRCERSASARQAWACSSSRSSRSVSTAATTPGGTSTLARMRVRPRSPRRPRVPSRPTGPQSEEERTYVLTRSRTA